MEPERYGYRSKALRRTTPSPIAPATMILRTNARSPAPRRILITGMLAVALGTSGCGDNSIDLPGLYRQEIIQGNIIDREMLGQIKFGMEKRKVRFILGTPLLLDPFHEGRWDYIYVHHSGSGDDAIRQQISLHFKDDRLEMIEGDIDPSVAEEINRRIKQR